MCLLVKQPKTTSFTDDFLKDVYTRNSDGLGVMYAEDNKLHVYKCLPASAQDFVDFYRKHADGKDCVWHARMQTHGDIDMDNCHPYQVTDDIWLAHNGVLSTGNSWDKAKSDTWHFIHNVLKPALSHNPDLILDPSYQSFLGDMIGRGNKFGLVRADGQTVIINEQSGVNFVGAWLSNTYAWSTTKFGFRSSYQGNANYSDLYSYGGYYGGWNDSNLQSSRWNGEVTTRSSAQRNLILAEDEGDESSGSVGAITGVIESKGQSKAPKGKGRSYTTQSRELTKRQVTPFVRALYNQWSRNGLAGIEQWVKDAPYKAAAVLSYWYSDVDDIESLVVKDPDEAAIWLEDLFRTDSVAPSMY